MGHWGFTGAFKNSGINTQKELVASTSGIARNVNWGAPTSSARESGKSNSVHCIFRTRHLLLTILSLIIFLESTDQILCSYNKFVSSGLRRIAVEARWHHIDSKWKSRIWRRFKQIFYSINNHSRSNQLCPEWMIQECGTEPNGN